MLFRQPQQIARIDRGNPLGAKVLQHISLGGSVREAMTSAVGVLGAGGSLVPNGVQGRSLRGAGASSRASIALNLYGRSTITMSFWMYWDAFANDDALAMEYGSPTYSTNTGILIDPNASGIGGLFLAGVGGPNSNLVAFPRPSAGAWHRITLAFDRTTGTSPSTRAWVDGVAQTVTTPLVNGAVSSTFSNDTLHLLSRSGTSLFGTGNLQDITIYDGILSNREAAEDFKNPWQIFQGPARSRKFFSASSVQSYSYTATGGIVLSGSVPAIRSAIKAASGGVTLSGTAPQVRGIVRATVGGITLGGAATVLRGLVRTATGGLLFSGSAPVSFTSVVQSLIVTPVGGIVISGTAAIVRTCTRLVSGGITFGGTSPVEFFSILSAGVSDFLRLIRRRGRR